MNSLKSILDQIEPLDEIEWQEAESLFYLRRLKKGEHLLREGQVAKEVGLVEKGLLKLYYLLEGQERTMLFFQEGQFVTDFHSFLTQLPSLRPIVAVEDTQIRMIAYESLQNLYESSPKWQKIGRILAERSYIYAIHRANRLLHDSPETLYVSFLQEHPDLIHRLPQYAIASYLHMTPETLSRVRKRIQFRSDDIPPSIHPSFPPGFL